MTDCSIIGEILCKSQRLDGYFSLVRRVEDLLEISVADPGRRITKCVSDRGEVRPESRLGRCFRVHSYADISLVVPVPERLSSETIEVAREAADEFLAFEQRCGSAGARP
jgi:hypothetical protein